MTEQTEQRDAGQAETRRDHIRKTAQAILPAIWASESIPMLAMIEQAYNFGAALEVRIELDDGPSQSGFMSDCAEGKAEPMPEPTHAPEPASGLAGFPDLRDNKVMDRGPFRIEPQPNRGSALLLRDYTGLYICESLTKDEARTVVSVLNNYNGLYSHAARLEARIAELEAAGVEDAEPVCTPETLQAWKSEMSTAIGPIELLKCFKVSALLSRVVAVAPEVAK